MSATLISKVDFSILFERLIEKCYPDQLGEVSSLPKYKLFGFDKAKNSFNSIKAKVSPVGKINGRVLYNVVKEYNEEQGDRIEIPAHYLDCFLAFLGYEEEGLETLKEDYFQEKGISEAEYKQPKTLKYLENKNPARESRNIRRTDERWDSLKNTYWWAYTRHDSSDGKKAKILRRCFQIKSMGMDDDYDVELWNQQPYSTFTGKILRKYSGDNLLACELTSTRRPAKKRMYVLFHVNYNLAGKGSLFLGIYLTHSDNFSIRASTIVLEKIDGPVEEKQIHSSESFFLDTNKLDSHIGKFLYEKNLNQIKLPSSIYHKKDLEDWLNKKQKFFIDYDLYVIAPSRSLNQHHQKIRAIKEELASLFSRFKDHTSIYTSLKPEINRLIDDHLLSNGNSITDFQSLQKEIKSMIQTLKDSQDININNVYYPEGDSEFDLDMMIDPGSWINEQLRDFRRSKAYLFIYPQPLVSSTLFQLGWAMMATAGTDVPIFIVYSRKADLPFLLRKADNLKSNNIIMTSLEDIGGIQGIACWIRDNKFLK